LTSVLAVNSYAVPSRAVVQPGADGELLFVPATPGDHLATPFFPVPASPTDRTLLVAAAPGAIRNVNCSLFIQDQALHVLGAAPCGDVPTAMDDTVISLPADVTSVRVFFQSTAQKTIVLPNRLRITYHHEGAAR
jgi:hypothetical protein